MEAKWPGADIHCKGGRGEEWSKLTAHSPLCRLGGIFFLHVAPGGCSSGPTSGVIHHISVGRSTARKAATCHRGDGRTQLA